MFDESQVYRIDHFLGKETVQNILAFRFGNMLFEPLWNRNYIEYVEITAAETIGVDDRGRLLRRHGSSARHDRQPPAAAPDADGDGAAGGL